MDIRCRNCDTLLARDFNGEYIEIKCRKCGQYNVADNKETLLTKPNKPDYTNDKSMRAPLSA